MKTSPNKLHSRFNLFKRVDNENRLICRDLSSSEASILPTDLSGAYRLKFAGMV